MTGSSDVIKPPEKPKVLDDDDDIFALKPAPASTGHKVKESSAASTTTTITRTIRKKAATKDENLFSDKTDIFADLAPPKAKDKRSTKTDKAVFVGGGGGEDGRWFKLEQYMIVLIFNIHLQNFDNWF